MKKHNSLACLLMILAGSLLCWGFTWRSLAQEEMTKEEESQAKAEEKAAAQEKDGDKDDEKPLPNQKELELKACGTEEVKYSMQTDKTTHPTPAPPAGKAMVYVIRPTMMGNKIQTKLAADGKWIGANRGNNYFFFPLDPGEHYLCSQAENRSLLVLTVEADKTYFLQQKIKLGFMKARNKLVLLSEAEGQAGLKKCHPAIATVKK